MSVTELIKQVAALPPEEKTLFRTLFHAMENSSQAGESAQRPQWPDFSKRLRQIYGDKVVPDSQSIIDYGRGDR